jgi:hypothetical protein
MLAVLAERLSVPLHTSALALKCAVFDRRRGRLDEAVEREEPAGARSVAAIALGANVPGFVVPHRVTAALACDAVDAAAVGRRKIHDGESIRPPG